MKHFSIFILTSFYFFSLMCCKDKKTIIDAPINTQEKCKGVEVIIYNQSGKPFENSKYIGFPLNHGYISNGKTKLDMVILSKSSNHDISVFPLAYFELKEGDSIRPFVLCLPEDRDFLITERFSFNEFMLKHSSMKLIIDTYLSSYKGLGKTKVVNWKDDVYALTYMKEFMNKPSNQ